MMTIIEIKPHRNGWKVFEVPDVEPIFPQKDQVMLILIGVLSNAYAYKKCMDNQGVGSGPATIG